MFDQVTEQRKLAAIMFTDMVGYSALTQRNEKLALEILGEHRQILRELFPKFNGNEIETTGDGFFVEFASAVGAARCAVAIQGTLATRNASAPPERKIEVRIGIHLGDVVHRDGEVLGDGVNIAARIEPLAEPGGICITRAVYEQIQNKLTQPFVPLGLMEVKNIRRPVEVYRIILAPNRAPVSTDPASDTQSSVRATGWIKKKSIAVLPFVNMHSDKENEFFSDGITEDLITALSQVKELRVPARTSSFAFKGKNEDIRRIGHLLEVDSVLEGSVRKAANRLRITAQLINVADGFHLWSERYDRDLQDVFEIQDEITRAIVTALKLKLGNDTEVALVKRHTENTEAYEFYLKGRYFWNLRGENLKKGKLYFELALLEDPNYALAYSGLADSYNGLGFYHILPSKETVPQAKAAARRALELDDSLAEAHTSLAYVSLFYEWDRAAAEKEFHRALELNPNYVPARYWYAIYLVVCERGTEALAEIRRAEQIDPLSASLKWHVGLIYYLLRHYDRAIAEFHRAIEIDPGATVARRWLGRAYHITGRDGEAFAQWQMYGKVSGVPSDELEALEKAYQTEGMKGYLQCLLGQMLDRAGRKYESPFTIALVYARLMQVDPAFEWLEKAFEERDPGMHDLKVNPDLDPLRSDPRFAVLERKVGFGK